MQCVAILPKITMASKTKIATVILLSIVAGCAPSRRKFVPHVAENPSHYEAVATAIEYPRVVEPTAEAANSLPPRTLRDLGELEYWELTLEECCRLALSNSTVIRDAGGRVIRAPAATTTVYNPAVTETDPRGGVEAALAAFDAQLAGSMLWAKQDRVFNNLLSLLGSGSQRDTATFEAELSKTAVTGTQFFLRNRTDYEASDSILNQFPSAYTTVMEAEVRHPLLQGSGIEFNRIAGPNSQPGTYNGVLLARLNTDISLSDFEMAVVDYVDELERVYWNLYYAYRDLDAKITARDASLVLWREAQERVQGGLDDPEGEARTSEQYFLLQSLVDNALSGSIPGTATFLSPTPPGVLALESQLRQLMGLPPSDGRLIRPASEPVSVSIHWDWSSIVEQALTRRVELRRQKWIVKRRELELLASKNFLQPRLDFVGTYRWFGLGDHLLYPDSPPELNSAFDLLTDGNYQEWSMGFQYSTYIGNRAGHVGVRNAELQLARDRAILKDQNLQVVHEVGNAIAQVDRTNQLIRNAYNRMEATRRIYLEVERKHEAGWNIANVERLLLARRGLAEAESSYYRSLVDYNEAILTLQKQQGTLLDYNQIFLSEGSWPQKAYKDAAVHASWWRSTPERECCTYPAPVSAGVHSQGSLLPPPAAAEDIAVPGNGEELPAPANPPGGAELSYPDF
jgi:Outer membrane efflux protein